MTSFFCPNFCHAGIKKDIYKFYLRIIRQGLKLLYFFWVLDFSFKDIFSSVTYSIGIFDVEVIKKILKVDYPRGRAKGYYANFISDKKPKIEFSLFYPTVS